MAHHALIATILGLALGAAAGAASAQRPPAPEPSPGLKPDPALGKPLYEKTCAVCHGANLAGTDKGPPFLHFAYMSGHHGDPSFQMAVKYGARAHHWKFGDMAPVPGVTPDDVAHITAYVREQQRRVGIH